MSSVNKVIIIGNLGKDPEVRYLPSGDAVANITVATTDRYKDKQTGEAKEITEWHRINFFGRQAEVAGQYLRKGSQVYVEGSLRTRKWTDKDGQEKYSTEIRADNMQMLGGKHEGQSSAPARQQPAPQNKPAGVKPSTGFDDMDDDIPFIHCSMSYDMETSKARRMSKYNY